MTPRGGRRADHGGTAAAVGIEAVAGVETRVEPGPAEDRNRGEDRRRDAARKVGGGGRAGEQDSHRAGQEKGLGHEILVVSLGRWRTRTTVPTRRPVPDTRAKPAGARASPRRGRSRSPHPCAGRHGCKGSGGRLRLPNPPEGGGRSVRTSVRDVRGRCDHVRTMRGKLPTSIREPSCACASTRGRGSANGWRVGSGRRADAAARTSVDPLAGAHHGTARPSAESPSTSIRSEPIIQSMWIRLRLAPRAARSSSL